MIFSTTLAPRSSLVFRWLVFFVLLALLEAAGQGFTWLRSCLHDQGFGFFPENMLIWLSSFVLFSGPLVVVEYFLPGTGTPKHYGLALLYWVIYMPFALASSIATQWIVSRLAVTPLFDIRLHNLSLTGFPHFLANAFLLVFSMVLFDLFLYWFHRLQHTSKLMWRFHQVHHANRSLNAIGCYHHPLEDVWRIPLFLLPMTLAFRVDAPNIMFLSAFISCWAYWSHMDSQLHFGPLRCVFVDNRYHRLHHSLLTEHFNRNFASYFAPWDRLFGTQCLPDPRNSAVQPPVGLDGVPTPANLMELWNIPFRKNT